MESALKKIKSPVRGVDPVPQQLSGHSVVLTHEVKALIVLLQSIHPLQQQHSSSVGEERLF